MTGASARRRHGHLLKRNLALCKVQPCSMSGNRHTTYGSSGSAPRLWWSLWASARKKQLPSAPTLTTFSSPAEAAPGGRVRAGLPGGCNHDVNELGQGKLAARLALEQASSAALAAVTVAPISILYGSATRYGSPGSEHQFTDLSMLFCDAVRTKSGRTVPDLCLVSSRQTFSALDRKTSHLCPFLPDP